MEGKSLFDERMALKMRLEQMMATEERIFAELRKERAFIFNRLRELDEEKNVSETVSNNDDIRFLESKRAYLEEPKTTTAMKRRGYPSRRSKTMKMRDIAIECLKEERTPVRGSDLQKKIEERTENRISNMTTFMNSLQKTDDNIIKLGRGLYIYRIREEDHTIYLGRDLRG